jgi:tetratricopeptide (TPR) repeat protein
MSELGQGAIGRAVRYADRLPEHEAALVRADLALTNGTLDGIEPLERAVRRRPDDAEAWYLLGETYFHLGPAALIPLEKSEQAFAHAVELDPRFAPAYIHRIDYAMLSADSARAAALIDSVARLTNPGADEIEMIRAIYDLGFGDSLAKDRAYRTLEDNSDNLVGLGLQDFRHPRFRDVEGRLYEIAIRYGSVNATVLAGLNQFHRGRPTAGRERVADPGFPPGARAAVLTMSGFQGLPVPDAEIDAALAVDPADLPNDAARATFLFLRGARASDQGRESDRAAARGALRDLAARVRVEGDSSTARFADGAGLALDGLLAWNRGDLDLAREFLDEARVEATGHGPQSVVNDVIRWRLGELLVEQGKLHAAEPYFVSLQIGHPMVEARLGDLYAKAGEPEKAREAYERFLMAWNDAEPEVEPIVARVRQALAGLAPLRRE